LTALPGNFPPYASAMKHEKFHEGKTQGKWWANAGVNVFFVDCLASNRTRFSSAFTPGY